VLTAFGVDSEDMWLLLRDRSPEVRAQAAAWATIAPSPSTIQRLITLLSDGNGLCRFTAQDALIRIGLGGSDALISALETANDDLKEKILIIAAATGDERFYGPAAQLAWDQSPRTRQLAAAVLASTGRSNAGQILVILLDDPSNAVVLAALVGLAKLSYWPAAATVERLLHHASWELRHQAGVTLMALGAPGIVMLRATARDEGPAAEMAERVLQLQALAIGSEAA
jgi:HEAT repeat protein